MAPQEAEAGAAAAAGTSEEAEWRPWQVGPWILEPRGLAACGNTREAPRQDIADRLRTGSASGASALESGGPGSYVDRLNKSLDEDQVITGGEVQQFLELSQQGDEVWEAVSVDAKTQVHRHRDRSLCGGVFVKLSAHLPEVQDLAHVATCYVDFKDRARWDKQLTDFRILQNVAGNDVLYSIMHAPPLSDRDFVVLQTICRHDQGRGLLIYSRNADTKFVPGTRAVRGVMYLMVIEIVEHPKGGAGITVTSAIDPRIPLLPKWIMNAFVPSEWRRFISNMSHHCQELAKAQVALPCQPLFAPCGEKLRTSPSVASGLCSPSTAPSLAEGDRPTSQESNVSLDTPSGAKAEDYPCIMIEGLGQSPAKRPKDAFVDPVQAGERGLIEHAEVTPKDVHSSWGGWWFLNPALLTCGCGGPPAHH